MQARDRLRWVAHHVDLGSLSYNILKHGEIYTNIALKEPVVKEAPPTFSPEEIWTATRPSDAPVKFCREVRNAYLTKYRASWILGDS